MSTDWSPRWFQNDLDRFYGRVVVPSLQTLRPHENLKAGKFASEDEGFEYAKKHTTNLVAYEARRCFALTLDAIFQRQLKQWAYQHFSEEEKQKLSKQNYPFSTLLDRTIDLHNLDVVAIHETIGELHLLANAVRHGDGNSLKKLRKSAPHLWPAKSSADDNLSIEEIEISDRNFVRYIEAVTTFWGIAYYNLHPDALTNTKPYYSEKELSSGF